MLKRKLGKADDSIELPDGAEVIATEEERQESQPSPDPEQERQQVMEMINKMCEN